MIWPRFRSSTWSQRGRTESTKQPELSCVVDVPDSELPVRDVQPVDA
jgi:hypothetical protein